MAPLLLHEHDEPLPEPCRHNRRGRTVSGTCAISPPRRAIRERPSRSAYRGHTSDCTVLRGADHCSSIGSIEPTPSTTSPVSWHRPVESRSAAQLLRTRSTSNQGSGPAFSRIATSPPSGSGPGSWHSRRRRRRIRLALPSSCKERYVSSPHRSRCRQVNSLNASRAGRFAT